MCTFLDPYEAAREYAARGWPVFPLHSSQGDRCSCGSRGCQNVGKHPRTAHGLRDASLDPAVIEGWWERWPDANVAIRTGDGLTVLDTDPRKGGAETWGRLLLEHGPELLDTYRVITGSGGEHLYYLTPPGLTIPSRSDVLGPGIDA